MAAALRSMEYDDDEKLDYEPPVHMPIKPDFPCHLRIALTDREFKLLKLDAHDAVEGDEVELCAMARVKHISHDDEHGSRVEFQIEKLGIESEEG